MVIMHEDPASVPLLSHYDNSESEVRRAESNPEVPGDSCLSYLSEVCKEAKELFIIAFPMIITGLLVYGKSAISMHFLGKMGKDILAGGSLAIAIANITGHSVISGLASGMEGIASQACGAHQWHLIGQTFQRTILILVSACILISILWHSFKPVFLLFHQSPTISSIATTYLKFSIPNLLLQSIMNPLKIYMRIQNVTSPLMLGASFALALHFLLNYVVVHLVNLGMQGVALVGAVTDLNLLAFLSLYLYISGSCSQSWPGWSFECFTQWKPILRQALPSCASVCLEWWWYELLILISSFLPNSADAVAATGIIMQATALIYNFPIALNMAVSNRVGSELGAYRPLKAKISSYTALLCAFLTGLISMVFFVTLRNAWGSIFTEDEAVLCLLASSMPVLGICEVGNSPQTTLCGMLRGSARPDLAAKINLFSFYCVGLPIAVIMGFCVRSFVGLWWALAAAQTTCVILMLIVLVARTDWKEQAEKARELTGGTNERMKEI